MKHVDYKTEGVCSVMIHFDIGDDYKIRNVVFDGGCNGNLKAISKIIESRDAKDISDLFRGITCAWKPTSCTDQLAKAIDEALSGS